MFYLCLNYIEYNKCCSIYWLLGCVVKIRKSSYARCQYLSFVPKSFMNTKNCSTIVNVTMKSLRKVTSNVTLGSITPWWMRPLVCLLLACLFWKWNQNSRIERITTQNRSCPWTHFERSSWPISRKIPSIETILYLCFKQSTSCIHNRCFMN